MDPSMCDRLHFFHDRWPVFYEDNHVLVLYKPAGLIMQRDHKNKANLLDLAKLWIKTRYNKPGQAFAGMVHRLDGPVAGVVVVARTSKGASRLSAQIRRGSVGKRYLAVVAGRPPKAADRLDQHLARKGRLSRIAAADTAGSQAASLRYRLVDVGDRRSLVAVELETGRRHQIRVQLAALGCPIIGDVTYGAPSALANGRIALLAHQLAFDHPVGGGRLQFETPTPQGWPWPSEGCHPHAPLWTIEAYVKDGLTLTGV
jgi:23S rRNA pseudouridine1911/1915/1917 synthase